MILITTCFDKFNQFQNFTSRSKQHTIIDLNENVCVRLIVSEAPWIRQEWVIVQTFQDTHEVLVPQFWGFAISVQCCVQFPLLSRSGGSANKSWSTSTCRNAVCTSIAPVLWSDSGSLLMSCELAASIVFRDKRQGCVRP